MSRGRFAQVAVLLLALAGCATSTDNTRLTVPAQPDEAARYPNNFTFKAWAAARHNQLPDPAIILSFSGGFMHAAALANEVLQALARYSITICARPASDGVPGGDCHRDALVDHIVAISSTSGGGFANVNFILNGPAGLSSFDGVNADETFGADGFLQRNLLARAFGQLGRQPWRLPTVLGPLAKRSPLMISILNDSFPRKPPGGGDTRTTFEFRDLSPDRPFAMFGATDYTAERHFIFTQDNFADICSDLSKYPLMDAVTASGAFPLLLTDVELRNYWADACPLRPTATFDSASSEAYDDETRYLDDRYSYALQHTGDASADAVFRPENYIHLFDGGISDNLAIRPLIRYVLNPDNLTSVFAHKTILYIEVNARSDPASDTPKHTGSPNLLDLSIGVPYASIDADTSLSNYVAITYARDLVREVRSANGPRPNAFYFAQVDFDQYMAMDMPNYPPKQKRIDQDKLKSLGGLAISKPDVLFLRHAAFNLLSNHPCFKQFLGDRQFTFQLDGKSISGSGQASTCIPEPKTPPQLTVAMNGVPPSPPLKSFVVFFAFGRWDISPEGASVIAQAVRAAKDGGFVRVKVTAHTDTTGSHEFNRILSIRRAQAVQAEMVRDRFDEANIGIEGDSFDIPLVPTGPSVREPQNRRAVIDLGSSR